MLFTVNKLVFSLLFRLSEISLHQIGFIMLLNYVHFTFLIQNAKIIMSVLIANIVNFNQLLTINCDYCIQYANIYLYIICNKIAILRNLQHATINCTSFTSSCICNRWHISTWTSELFSQCLGFLFYFYS